MPTLHIGVIDIPYADEAITTGEVAKILEARYGVMSAFYQSHKADIQTAIAKSLQGQVVGILNGKPLNSDPYVRACADIDSMFKQFLSLSEIEKMGIEGVPTKAALDGKTSRFKAGKNKGNRRGKVKSGSRRPSFIDTGTYQASEKSWVE